MAQPIPLTLTPKEPDPAERLEAALHEHTDAIVSALELLQLLHDRGVLDFLRGLVGAGDEVAGKLAAAAASPETLRGMRNLIVLTKVLASIPLEKGQEAPSVLQLLRRAGSEESRRAIAMALDLLESVGKPSEPRP